jgi:hypothetical protein
VLEQHYRILFAYMPPRPYCLLQDVLLRGLIGASSLHARESSLQSPLTNQKRTLPDMISVVQEQQQENVVKRMRTA